MNIITKYISALLFTTSIYSCTVGNGSISSGEVIGIGSPAWTEPTPYGMVLIDRGSIAMGPAEYDSIWNIGGNPAEFRSMHSGWMKLKSPMQNTDSLYSG